MKVNNDMRFLAKLAATASFALMLTGCATFSEDGGFGDVGENVKERLGKDPKWVRSEADAISARAAVQQMLGKPLSVDDAIQITLLNNQGLQATYAELGIAEADLVQAGRLRNPGFSFARLTRGDEKEIERAFFFDFAGLVTMPLRSKLEGRRFEAAKLRVAAETLQVAAETRKAFFSAVAAGETVKYMDQVNLAAEASADLARRMARAGNWGKLDQAREQLFYAEATAQLARARQTFVSNRERLTRLMGLWGEDIRFALPERLPDLPGSPRELADIESLAIKQRLDVQSAKQETESIARSLGLSKATSFINVLELGYLRNSETGEPRQTGYEIEISIPLFDWGGAHVAKAESIYMQSVNRLAETAINARSQVREVYSGYRTAYDIAKHYRDEIVPLRKKIADENLLRYNGMLIGVFELIADAREQVMTVNASIEALRDFWLTESDLEMALTGEFSDDGGATFTPAAMTDGSAGGGH
jgi:outer membrane protein TolC